MLIRKKLLVLKIINSLDKSVFSDNDVTARVDDVIFRETRTLRNK